MVYPFTGSRRPLVCIALPSVIEKLFTGFILFGYKDPRPCWFMRRCALVAKDPPASWVQRTRPWLLVAAVYASRNWENVSYIISIFFLYNCSGLI